MTILDELIKQFERFPGIGSRQARRFAYHLLTEDSHSVAKLAELISNIKGHVTECDSCFRFFVNGNGTKRCPLCSSAERDASKLMIVERESDLDTIERSKTYDGYYFVLGGTVPLLNTEHIKRLRGGALKFIVEERAKAGLSEIIIAFSVNPDGENTARYVESLLRDIAKEYSITISELGRGLSTGSELEYADPETITNAFRNRH